MNYLDGHMAYLSIYPHCNTLDGVYSVFSPFLYVVLKTRLADLVVLSSLATCK